MKKFEELTESEVALRALIYAVENKDKWHPDHPMPLGEAYLAHVLLDVKETAVKLGIPLVEHKF